MLQEKFAAQKDVVTKLSALCQQLADRVQKLERNQNRSSLSRGEADGETISTPAMTPGSGDATRKGRRRRAKAKATNKGFESGCEAEELFRMNQVTDGPPRDKGADMGTQCGVNVPSEQGDCTQAGWSMSEGQAEDEGSHTDLRDASLSDARCGRFVPFSNRWYGRSSSEERRAWDWDASDKGRARWFKRQWWFHRRQGCGWSTWPGRDGRDWSRWGGNKRWHDTRWMTCQQWRSGPIVSLRIIDTREPAKHGRQ